MKPSFEIIWVPIILIFLSYIEATLQEELQKDKGMGCEMPKLNPFAQEIMKFDKKVPKLVCKGRDWVKCYVRSHC